MEQFHILHCARKTTNICKAWRIKYSSLQLLNLAKCTRKANSTVCTITCDATAAFFYFAWREKIRNEVIFVFPMENICPKSSDLAFILFRTVPRRFSHRTSQSDHIHSQRLSHTLLSLCKRLTSLKACLLN